jgi:hypothetical protein
VCGLLSGGSLSDLAGGTIKWSPDHKIAASTGVALAGGSVSVITVDGKSYLQITYTGGSVAGGSFTNASGASFTAISRQTTTRLSEECANGHSDHIEIDGTLTL